MLSASFSPISALIGGGLIGLAAAILWVFNGRVAGISNILSDFIPGFGHFALWRLLFTAALILGSVAAFRLAPPYLPDLSTAVPPIDVPFAALAGGAVLIGFGARLANGCTSGHGICGLARFSVRSFVSVAVFMAVAILVASVIGSLS